MFHESSDILELLASPLSSFILNEMKIAVIATIGNGILLNLIPKDTLALKFFSVINKAFLF